MRLSASSALASANIAPIFKAQAKRTLVLRRIISIYSDKKTNLESPDMMWYLNAANQALKSHTASSSALESKEPIEPLLKTSWGQDTPYNNLCPTERENKKAIYPTGCVATAMAQVMYYHQYPEKGTGNITYSFQDRILSLVFLSLTLIGLETAAAVEPILLFAQTATKYLLPSFKPLSVYFVLVVTMYL